MRQPDILDRCLMIVARLCPYLVGAVLLLALAGMLSAQEYYSVRRGGWRREAAAPVSPYWVDTNSYAGLWEFETTNETATLDTSGNNLHLTNMPSVASGPTWIETGTNSQGRIEHGYSFDGSDDVFLTGFNQSIFNMSNDFCVGGWFYIASLPIENKSILEIHGDGHHEWRFGYDQSSNKWGVAMYELAYDRTLEWEFAEATNTWYFMAATQTNGSRQLYFNGSVVVSRPTITNLTTYTTLRVGNNRTDGYEWYGQLDNIFIITNSAHISIATLDAIYANTHPTNNLRLR